MSFDPTQYLADLNADFAELERDLVAGMREVAEIPFARSQELVPVSPTNPKHPYYTGTSGDLARSGTVGEPVVTETEISVEEGYHTDYAAAVHNRLANHQYPGAVNPKAQDHYLEQAFREFEDRFIPELTKAVEARRNG